MIDCPACGFRVSAGKMLPRVTRVKRRSFMDHDKISEAKAAAARIATTDKRIKLPIWAWVAAGLVLVVMGAAWFG